jgi:threonine dehydrogenase-like Zn-dependent dehydrogenase
MRAAIFRNGDIVVDDVADPTPGEGQVLVKTLCCGICGTDLHAAKFTQQFVERTVRAPTSA